MKALAWVVSWVCYGIGHFISHVFYRFDSLSTVLYPIYNKLMIYSSDLSDKYDLNIWMSRQQRYTNAINTLKEALEEDDEFATQFYQQLSDFATDASESLVIGNLVATAILENVFDIHVGYSEDKVDDVIDFGETSNESDFLFTIVDDSEGFQLGKTYRHTGGRMIYICGTADTTVHGKNCLIAEERDGSLYPVGRDKEAMTNWNEVPIEEWNQNFS